MCFLLLYGSGNLNCVFVVYINRYLMVNYFFVVQVFLIVFLLFTLTGTLWSITFLWFSGILNCVFVLHRWQVQGSFF